MVKEGEREHPSLLSKCERAGLELGASQEKRREETDLCIPGDWLEKQQRHQYHAKLL